jgi:hypothetical protein
MRFLYIIGLLVFMHSFFGCQKRLKNTEDYHPVLEIEVEVVLGGIKVTGTVAKEGAAPLEVLGFCFSKNAEFPINENQGLADYFDGKTFSYTYPAYLFEEGATYNFKAFATSDYGYVVSNVSKISDLVLLSADAPCENNPFAFRYGTSLPNSIDQNTFTSQSFDYIEYLNTIQGGPAVIGIQFRSPPSNGIYTSSQFNFDLSPTEARIYIGMNGVTLEGGLIYVNHLGGNEYSIETCDVPFRVSATTTSTLNAHWTIKL